MVINYVFNFSDRIHADAGYMSSPERGGGAPPRSYPPSYAASTTPYEDPYYSQYSSRTGSITPVIDEEARWVDFVIILVGCEYIHIL